MSIIFFIALLLILSSILHHTVNGDLSTYIHFIILCTLSFTHKGLENYLEEFTQEIESRRSIRTIKQFGLSCCSLWLFIYYLKKA